MPADRVIIEELFLRLPGLSAAGARDVAHDVAQALGHGLAQALPSRALGTLDLKVVARAGASRDEMVSDVVTAILQALVR